MANFDTWRADPLSEAILEQSSVASAELEVSMLERASSVCQCECRCGARRRSRCP